MPVPMESRLNMVLPAELKDEVQRAALRQGAREGEPVSIAKWIREAIRERLAREESEQ